MLDQSQQWQLCLWQFSLDSYSLQTGPRAPTKHLITLYLEYLFLNYLALFSSDLIFSLFHVFISYFHTPHLKHLFSFYST